MGWRRCSAICLKLDLESPTRKAKLINREIYGATNSASSGEGRLTTVGIDQDRSIYAWISDEEPPALHRSRGEESRIVRQHRQIAVALTRSRCFAKTVAMRTIISVGSWLMDAREFLISAAFLDIPDSLRTVSPTCNKPESENWLWSLGRLVQTGLCIAAPATRLSGLESCDEPR